MALDDDHQYLGSATTSMDSTYQELKRGDDDEKLSLAADDLNSLIDKGISLDDAVAQVVADYRIDEDDLDDYMNK